MGERDREQVTIVLKKSEKLIMWPKLPLEGIINHHKNNLVQLRWMREFVIYCPYMIQKVTKTECTHIFLIRMNILYKNIGAQNCPKIKNIIRIHQATI